MTTRSVIRKATVGISARTLGGGRHTMPTPEPASGAVPAAMIELPAGAVLAMPGVSAAEGIHVPPAHEPGEAEIDRRASDIAKKRIEEQAQAAMQAAHKKGYAEGLAAAEVLVRQEVETLRQRASQLLSGLEAALQAERAASENLALQIALTSIGKLLGESAGDADMVARLVRQAAVGLHGDSKVTVKLGSADTRLLREHGIDLSACLPAGLRSEIIEDPGIDTGGCIIESEHGTIDARLDGQLRALCGLLRDVYGARRADTRTDGESV